MANKPSEGEIFLAEYFKAEGISYTSEKEIMGLKGDSKKYRKADFYLTNFNLYVEFYGLWNNSKEDRERYREKKKVYQENRIPCIYIYPENLGIIDFTFPRRAIKEFEKLDMGKELLKFRLKYIWLYKQGNIIYFLLALFVLLFSDFTWQEDSTLYSVLIFILLYQTYNIYSWIQRKLVL